MAHPVGDYLNSVLQQRGANALPYEEDVKWVVREHLLELQKVGGGMEGGV